MKKVPCNLMTVTVVLAIMLISGTVSASPSAIDGHWAANTLTTWASKGLINGYEDGNLRPNQPITRAEFVCLINRAIGRSDDPPEQVLSDLAPSDWFYDDVLAALSSGFIGGYPDGSFRPHQFITRQEAASILSRLVRLGGGDRQSLPRLVEHSDEWSQTPIAIVTAHGLMGGYPDGTFRPSAPLTRAEAVVILDRLSQGLSDSLAFSQSGTYGPTVGLLKVAGDITVHSPDLVLERMAISGDLVIAPSVGDGSVELKHLSVSGSLLINGGGSHSIIMTNAEIGQAVVNSTTIVRVVTRSDTSIASITVETPAILETSGSGSGFAAVTIAAMSEFGAPTVLRGNFEQVLLIAPHSRLTIEGHIGNLVIDQTGEGSEITIAHDAAVGSLLIHAPVRVFGEGKIGTVHLSRSGVELSISPAEITLDDGAQATVLGSEYPVKTPEPLPQPSPPLEPSKPIAPPVVQPVEIPGEPSLPETPPPVEQDPAPQTPPPDPVEDNDPTDPEEPEPLPAPPSDRDLVERAASELTVSYALGDSASGVTQNLTLSKTTENGVSITWESSDPTTIDGDGVVTRPPYIDGDRTVILTATVIKGDTQEDRQFVIVVVRQEVTDVEAVGLAMASLQVPERTDCDLALPLAGDYGTTISWQSDNQHYLTDQGQVNRPNAEIGNVNVTLTATVSKEDAILIKTFTVLVMASDQNPPPVFLPGYPKVVVAPLDRSASFLIRVDEDCDVYYVVLASGTTPPSVMQVKSGQDATSQNALFYGSATVIGDLEQIIQLNGLTPSTAYTLYMVAEDTYPSLSLQTSVTPLSFTTAQDKSAPVFEPGYPFLSSVLPDRAEVSIKLNERSRVYHVTLLHGSPAPLWSQMKAAEISKGIPLVGRVDFGLWQQGSEGTIRVNYLQVGKYYDIYLTAEDYATPTNPQFTITKLTTAPQVVNP